MKKLVFLFFIPLLVVSCTQVETGAEASTQEVVRDGIFIHVTAGYEDAHRVLMPFKMATLMADSKDVILYLDIHAVELVVRDAEDLLLEGFDPLSTYISSLTDKGVGIYACPTCLNVAGYSTDDLKEGIKPANKDAFFDFTDGRILTIDY